ncbi:MAG TPA: DUF1207 domain-containing protein [Methylomirabilota bacterium]|nr:DUF1207 domain-containing protein [Methylomirabilota bacterium]
MRPGALVLALLAVLAFPPSVRAAPPSDAWLEGYATAVLARELGLSIPSLRATQGVITLSAVHVVAADQARVLAALQTIPGVTRVEMVGGPAPAPRAETPIEPPRVLAEWQTGLLPGGTLFRSLIADPRWPHFAASYQRYLHDSQLRDVGAASFGETFTLLRDRLGPAWWEIGVQAGVFAVFDLDAESKDLVNADYLVAVPLSARYGDWSAMFRLFHQSSHLGDEFLLRTRTERINLSYESVDLRVSYEFGDVLRLYGGGGFLFDQEPASLDPWSVQYGIEFISPWPPRDAGWRPIAALDLQNREENKWSLDFSLRTGIQLDGVLVSRNLQILLEYFKGRSPNGQFYKEKIEYLGLGVHFHF